MNLQMMTDRQFTVLKNQTAVKGATRKFAEAELVAASQTLGDRLTHISLHVGGGGKKVLGVTAMLDLSVEYLRPSHVRELISKPVEVVYEESEKKGPNPPSIYGKVVALKSGDTILHDFFLY